MFLKIFFPYLLSFSLFLLSVPTVRAQVLNQNPDPTAQQNNLFQDGQDSTIIQSDADWKDEAAKIYYHTLHSALARYPDTSISRIHRYQPQQPWWGKDLGNYGTAVRNTYFTPDVTPGLKLGYSIYNMYRLSLDSLPFYNTTRPYSSFSALIGSKSQQNVDLLHTQNIHSRWNFAARIRYNAAPGFYAMQKATNLSSSLGSNYQSKNQRYYLATAFVYNRFVQQENGGLVSVAALDSSRYSNRMLIPVRLPATTYGGLVAAVSNTLRDWDLYLQQNYAWGRSDTLYNEDSTSATYSFTPRFRLKHQLQLHSEKHIYRDKAPDSLRYDFIQPISVFTRDSVYGVQDWFYVDNKVSLNGFIGNRKSLLLLEVGLGNRVDRFASLVPGLQMQKEASVSNYLFALLQKEAFNAGQWYYQAHSSFFFSGPAAGNFDLNASIGKDLSRWGSLQAGIGQSLSQAPYSWQSFSTNKYIRSYDFDKMSVTQLWARLNLNKIKLQLEAKNYLITNYLYFNESMNPSQYVPAFSLLQLYARKEFRWRIFALDNEAAWQQTTGNAPVHVPSLLLRHQLRVETFLFKKALLVASGLEVRYSTSYYPDAYTPYFNQFYYQTTTRVPGAPECSAFFNFKVRSFRAFVLVEQLQQLVSRNVINAPHYPAENAMFKFGFNWTLIN